MGVKAILLCAAATATCWAQDDPMRLLIQLRHKITESTRQLPRYLCTETVDRKNLQPDRFARGRTPASCTEILAARNSKPKPQLLSTDRLRLDVAFASDGEIYSWVGAEHFADQSLGDLVKQGATSTGAFGSFLRAIFVADSAAFAFKGEGEAKGRAVLDYTFRVPLWRSGYVIGNQTLNRLTAYHGSFSIDPKTLDLVRVEIETDPLSPELEICAATTTLDYGQVRMNNVDFPLPSEVNLEILNSDGSESLNRTTFTGCHQFLGESKLIVEDRSSANAALPDATFQPIKLAGNLKVSVALADSIDPATAAAGDPITGKLKRPVRDGQFTIPAGTLLQGRIHELRASFGEETYLELSLKWERILLSGRSQPVELSLKSAVPGTAKGSTVHSRWPEIGSGFQVEDRGVGHFVFSDIRKNYRIPAGFVSEWVTASK